MGNLSSAIKCSSYHVADYIEECISEGHLSFLTQSAWDSTKLCSCLYQECSEGSEEEEWLHMLFTFSGFPFLYSDC